MAVEGLDLSILGGKPVEEVVTVETVPPIETPKEEVKVEITESVEKTEPVKPVEEENEVNPYSYFAEQIGLKDFTPTDEYEAVEGLAKIAQIRINELENQVQQFSSNSVIAELQNHINEGGTLETFKAIQSIENEYSGIKIDYENETDLEKFSEWYLKDIKGEDDEDVIKTIIDGKKDKGVLKEYVSSNLQKLVETRDREVEKERAIIENSIKEEKVKEDKYFKDLEESFSKISLEKDIVDKVKMLSLPDKRTGSIGIYDIYNNMTPEQTALMHSFAYKMVNKLPIEYKIEAKKKVEIPVLAGKASAKTTGNLGITDLARMVNEKKE